MIDKFNDILGFLSVKSYDYNQGKRLEKINKKAFRFS